MTPRRLGPFARAWQHLYAAGHARRRRRAAVTAHHLPRPVVSVGNLHWGGGGKTPLVAAIAARLAAQGLAVTILSRGYRSTGHGVRLASRGDGLLLPPEVVGDEPAQLAASLPGVSVVVHPDRAAAGLWSLAELQPAPDLFLLDDGFSHVHLARDLDLLAFPAADPLAGGWLWPQGRLREPLASAAAAHAALLTGDGDPEMARALARELADHGLRGPLFRAPTHALAPTLDGAPLERGRSVLLVSGVARPASVRITAEAAGLLVRDHLVFPDHHPYPTATCAAIERRAAALGGPLVVVTEKDAVKLAGRLAVPLAVLRIASEPEDAFWHWFADALAPLLAPAWRTFQPPAPPRSGAVSG